MKKDCFVSIHTRNLWFLVVEIFKIVKGLELKIFCELFLLKEPKHYSLRHRSLLRYLEIRQCVIVSKTSRIRTKKLRHIATRNKGM